MYPPALMMPRMESDCRPGHILRSYASRPRNLDDMKLGDIANADAQKYGKPLDGVRVLAAEQMQALPFATQMLARLGAAVVKGGAPGGGGSGGGAAPPH